jgi:uncharacterized membrane protein (UPF0127 family)
MRTRLILMPFVAAAMALAACSHPADAGTAAPHKPAVHPVSGLPVIPLTVTHGARRLAFRVEVASTPEQQERGLMFRTSMGANDGMIFPMKPPRPASFWMKNTVIPLDIIFIGTNGRILNIAANAVPYSLQPVYSLGDVKGVLELNGGRAAELGIEPGDKVVW